MNNLFNLIRNELGKIYVLKSTRAMYIILVGLAILGHIMTNTSNFVDTDKTYSDDWETELQENEALMTEIEEEADDDPFLESTNMSVIQENNYHLENDVRPYGYHAGTSFWITPLHDFIDQPVCHHRRRRHRCQ